MPHLHDHKPPFIRSALDVHSKMPTLKLHYDGWLTLPAGLRLALGLNSGDRLEAELVNGALVLRPANKARNAAPIVPSVNASVADVPEEPSPEPAAVPAKRRAGRPRKTEGDGGQTGTGVKARGRPRTATETPELGRAASPLVGLGPAKLVKKVDLEAKATAADPATPTVMATPRVIRPDRISQPVERRPFRNVEVRPLGAGRGHNRNLARVPTRLSK